MLTRNCFSLVVVVCFLGGATAAEEGTRLEPGKSLKTTLTKQNSKWASGYWRRPFSVKLNAGDNLTVQATAPGKVKLQIYVLSPSGKQIKKSGKGSPLTVSTGSVPADGDYTINVYADDLATVEVRADLKKK